MDPMLTTGLELTAFLAGLYVMLGDLDVGDKPRKIGMILAAATLGGLTTLAGHSPDFAEYYSAVLLYASAALGVYGGGSKVNDHINAQAAQKAQDIVAHQQAEMLSMASPLHDEDMYEMCNCPCCGCKCEYCGPAPA